MKKLNPDQMRASIDDLKVSDEAVESGMRVQESIAHAVAEHGKERVRSVFEKAARASLAVLKESELFEMELDSHRERATWLGAVSSAGSRPMKGLDDG